MIFSYGRKMIVVYYPGGISAPVMMYALAPVTAVFAVVISISTANLIPMFLIGAVTVADVLLLKLVNRTRHLSIFEPESCIFSYNGERFGLPDVRGIRLNRVVLTLAGSPANTHRIAKQSLELEIRGRDNLIIYQSAFESKTEKLCGYLREITGAPLKGRQ